MAAGDKRWRHAARCWQEPYEKVFLRDNVPNSAVGLIDTERHSACRSFEVFGMTPSIDGAHGMLDEYVLPEDDWPHWLIEVAVKVDEFVQSPDVMRRFREEVVQWREHYEKVEESVEILPRRAMTLPEKYAAMAAIHDKVYRGPDSRDRTRWYEKLIDPWQPDTVKGDSTEGFDALKAWTPYYVMMKNVEDLKDEDRPRIESVLHDVEADLKSIEMSDAKGHESRRSSDAGEQSDDSEKWMRVSEAARASAVNSGTISRACNREELVTNGKKKRLRRVDRADFTRWLTKRSCHSETEESTEQVQRLMKTHVTS